MADHIRPRVKYVIGPDGSPLTIADLPAPTTKRWVIRRKAEVVAAVRGGLLSLEEACDRYTLTVEEFLSWQMSIDQLYNNVIGEGDNFRLRVTGDQGDGRVIVFGSRVANGSQDATTFEMTFPHLP